MPTNRSVEGIVLLNIAEHRIRQLWRARKWYRANPGRHLTEREADMAELHYLVAMLREARLVSAHARVALGAGDHYVGMA
jgi:hypothetical protein